MGLLQSAQQVWRDFVSDGIASSGKHTPKKSDIRTWGTWVEGVITAFVSSGGSIYPTLAALNADLTKPANSMAWVTGDPVAANNGVYGKIGAAGSGSWTRRTDLPFSFISGSDAGAGSANAIQATTSVPVSSSALVLLNIFRANTGSPVTVSFNGGIPLTVKTNSGNNPAAGGLVAGMMVLGVVSGSNFRLVNDQVSGAIVAAAEAAQTAAAASAIDAANSAAAAQASATSVANRFAGQVIKADATADSGFNPSANGIGYSLNTNGSTGFPSPIGETISLMFGGAGRAFDIFKSKGVEAWYFRQVADDGSFGAFRQIYHEATATQIAGADSAARVISARFGDSVDLEEFGFVGTGASGSMLANNAAMARFIAYAAANPQKTYRSRRGQIFRLSAGNFFLPAGLTLYMEGAKFQIGASLGAATTFITTSDNSKFDAIEVDVISGISVSRAICINGQNTKVDLLKAASALQQPNSSALLDAAVRIYGGNHEIGTINVENFDQAWAIWGDPAFGINYDTTIRSARIKNYVRGGYVRNVSGLTLFDNRAKGRSPNAGPNPGHNALLLDGAEKSRFIGGLLEDAAEHNLRTGGFRDATAGTGQFVATSRYLTFVDYTLINSGQSGFKAWSGSTAQVHYELTLSNVHAINCGSDGNALGFNDMGFMIQNVDGFTATNCSVSARDSATYSAYDGWFLHGISRGRMAACASYKVQRNGLRLSEYSDDGTSGSLDPLGINSLDVANFVGDQQAGAGIYLNFPGSSSNRDIMIADAHLITCTNGVESNAAVGRFVQLCYVSAVVRGNTGSKFSVVSTANLKVVDLTA